MRTKASLTNSPLAHPLSPIHRLASRLQEYLHFPDPYPLYILMAALVANYANGRPVWLMLIGPPSCGKSELLNSLLSLPRIVEGGAITGPGALLSATRRRERSKDATGGLLREIGERGGLVVKEFNSILSLGHETLKTVLGAFREIYDGRWTRQAGTDGGQDLTWAGKMAFLTGCTESIDHHHQAVSDMGERFIFYRWEHSAGWAEAYRALSVCDVESLSSRLQDLILAFADEIALDWDIPVELPYLDSHDKQRIIAFSQFASSGRSAVIRDPYTKEIVQASMSEYPIRLSLALSQVLRSLRYIGVDDSDSWRMIRKAALDSIPGTRRLALLALLAGRDSASTIADHVRVSTTTIKRSLEELEVHNMVERTDTSKWAVSSWAKDRLLEACNGTGLTGLKLTRR